MDKYMRLYKSKTINSSEADKLIEKYYDGCTTVEEERKLRLFLLQTKLTDKYKVEIAMFGYLKAKKKRFDLRLPGFAQQAAVVAVILITAFTIQNIVYGQGSGYAIVNGVKITNKEEINKIAMASLHEISSTNNEVETELNAINNTQTIQNQLDVFNNMDAFK
jgi:hypothetical protein